MELVWSSALRKIAMLFGCFSRDIEKVVFAGFEPFIINSLNEKFQSFTRSIVNFNELLVAIDLKLCFIACLIGVL